MRTVKSVLLRICRECRIAAVLAVSVMALIAVPDVSGQGDAMLTHYWAVPTYYNPAAVGDTDYLRLRGGSRLQWVGIDNAPRTFLATADMPFVLAGKRFGAGLAAQQESMGLYRNLTVSLQLGYKLRLLKGELTLALQGGFLNEQFKGSEVYIPDGDDFHQPADEAIPDHDVAGNAFDVGLGAYYRRGSSWIGLALLHANNPTVTLSSEGTGGGITGGIQDGGVAGVRNFEFTAPRVLYFTAGSNIKVKNTLLEVIPSILVRSDFDFTSFELTGRLRYNSMFSAGVGYRYKDAVSLMLGAEIKGIFLGYSYDYNFGDIAGASSGSHEIFAGYSLKLDFSEKNRNKHKSIRIM